MTEKVQVRIVAGSLRGRKLTAVVHPGLRPTPQMVREALFSILGNAIPGRAFYDVFAGTGVVGLEAISRGATSARFIEKDPRQVADIQKYAQQFGVADQVQTLRADSYRWAERWLPPDQRPVNIFLSPPFPDLSDKTDEFLTLVRTILEKAPDESVVIIQAEEGFPTHRLPDVSAWDMRSYGRNRLFFYVVSRSPSRVGDGNDEPPP
jgi:16S rRNA (guanine(966)-N(2))-methyltransferase RsmD